MKAKTIDLTDIAQIQDRLRTSPSRPQTRVRYIKAIGWISTTGRGMEGWRQFHAATGKV